MKNNTQKFALTELQALDDFLRSQTSNMTLVKAHGFITAVASFPDLFLPSEWIPVLIGDFKPNSNDELNKIMLDSLITMYRQIGDCLGSERRFDFLLSAQQPNLTIEQASPAEIQEWCNGYCLALVWNETEWLNVAEEFITQACATFFMITDLIKNSQLDVKVGKSDKRKLIKNLPELVKALYIYWLGKQDDLFVIPSRSHNDTLCPCGSFKLYNDCCWLEMSVAVVH